MTDQEHESRLYDAGAMEPEQRERRNFLLGLGKWSKAVIGGVVLGGVLVPVRDASAVGWANRNDGNRTWVNFGGGGWGPGWNNRGWNNGGWYNRGWNNGGWFNRPWHNRGWTNRPWHNRGGWHNGSGWGGSWANR